jgi:endo-1,4-beta-D-glucanase Y/PKD repeat protein
MHLIPISITKSFLMKKLLHLVVIFLARKSTSKISLSMMAIACLLLSTAGLTHGQGAYPFPQNTEYTYGRMPDGVNSQVVQAAYTQWKADFVTSSGACGYRRVIFDYYPGTGRGKEDRSRTVSEGIAYGMLIAAYMDDRALFDDLWNYYKRNRNGNGVMNWMIDANCQVVGANGASDAELDVAMALIVASHQWQSDSYVNDAKSMIRIIREKEFDGNVLRPGDQFGGNNLVCPSYFSPAYYRVFKDYDTGHASFWDNAATRGYQIINAAAGPTGLVPDWSTAAGGVSNEATQYEDQGKNFIFDAIRTPFRSGIDYLWHGNADAKAYCAKISTWLVGSHGSANDIGSKYGTKLNNNDGQKLGHDKNNTFIGCFGVGLMGADMASAQGFLNSTYNTSVSLNPGYGQYFNATFKLLSLMVMTGNFYLPPPDQCDAPNLGPDVSLCSGSITLNANVTGRTYVWKRNGVVLAGKTTQTLAVTEAGSYEVVATEIKGGKSCVRRDKIEVGAATMKADFIAKAAAGSIILENTSIGGISNYTWTLDGGDPQTTENATYTSVPDGSHTIVLTVDNSGYGCTQTNVATKTVVVGAGVGVAVDDFTEANDRKIYGFGFGGVAAPLKKKCSADALVAECPDYPCGFAEIKLDTKETPAAHGAFGFAFETADAPYNLTDIPYVSVKLYATKPVELGVKLIMQSSTVDISSNSKFVEVTTTPQVFTLDFSDIDGGWDNKKGANGGTTTVAAWNAVTGIQFRPFEVDAKYDGTVYIDWFVVGAKGLPAPTMSIKVDKDGYTDYSNYLPTYYPNDPQYAACKTSTASCYGKVNDWLPAVSLCAGETKVLEVKSCTAEQVRWYKGTTFLQEGFTYEVTTSGKYYVELINQGGKYLDSVDVVVGSELVADFTALADPKDKGRGIRFYNNSLNYDTWSWDYGTTDIEPGSTAWEEGYNYYNVDKTYEVCLTVSDATCGQTKTICKDVVIECVAPLSDIAAFKVDGIAVTNDTITTCGDKTIKVSIDAVTNAAKKGYGWYGISTTSLSDTNFVSQKFAVSQMLKVEAYNECGEKVTDSVFVKVTPAPVAEFTAIRKAGTERMYKLEATWVGDVEDGVTYEWTIGGASIGSGIYIEHEVDGAQDITLTVTNACGTDDATETVGCNLPIATAAKVTGTDSFCGTSDCETYTLSGVTGATSYEWTVTGGELCAPSATTTANIKFTATGKVSVTALNACGATTPIELDVVVGTIPTATAITGNVSPQCSATGVAYSVNGGTNSTYVWTVPSGATIVGGTGTASILVNFGSTEGDITVVETSAAGCEGEVNTLAIELAPIVTSAITGNATPECSATGVSYSVNGGTNSTYVWTVPSGATIASGVGTSAITVNFGTTNGNVSVVETSAGGCVAEEVSMLVSLENCALGANFSVSPKDVCTGSEVTITDISTGVTANTTYEWTFGAGATPATASTKGPHKVTYATEGEKTINLKIVNGELEDQYPLTIQVGSKPISPSTITGPAKACQGKVSEYSIDAIANATDYTWTYPAGATGVKDGNKISITFGAQGGNITVTPKNACGAGTTVTLPVTVSSCTLNANFSVSNNDICTGTAITVTDLSTGDTDGAIYTWSFGTGATPATASTKGPHSVTYSSTGPKTISLNVVNGDLESTFPMTVNVIGSLPVSHASITGTNTACQGIATEYSIPFDENATSYTWKFPQGATGTPSGNKASVKFGATGGEITVTPTSSCGSGTTAKINVSVEASTGLTEITLGDAATEVCGIIAYYYTNEIPGVTYTWTVPYGSKIMSQDENSIAVLLGSNNGKITVTADIVATGNCSGAGARLERDLIINCTTKGPEIEGPKQVDPNQTAEYEVPNNPGSTYTWTVPEGAVIVGSKTGNKITVAFGPTANGNITLVEKKANGTTLPASSIGVSNAVATYKAFAINYDMYPNPFTNSSIIRVNTPGKEAVHISIMDERGLMVSEISGHYSNESIELGNGLKSGVYFVKLTMENKTEVVKLVKIK